MRRLGLLIILLTGVFTVTCARITVNVYFPVNELNEAAEDIEREVRQSEGLPEDADPGIPTGPPPKSQSLHLWPRFRQIRVAFHVPQALAQQVNINKSTPAIRGIIATRKKRFASLAALFTKGVLGEDNRGLVQVRASAGASLQDKARAKSLSSQENRDRQRLYAELAKANNLPPDKTAEIGRIFAGVNRRQARSGWPIQEDSGQWRQK